MFQTRHRQTGVLWPAGGNRSDSRKKRSTMREKQQLDMLHGTIWDKIPRFALPVAATAILEQLFNASDIAVVGNFTGEARTVAVAAAIALILSFGKPLLSVFNNDPAVLVYRPSRRFAAVERGEGDGTVL